MSGNYVSEIDSVSTAYDLIILMRFAREALKELVFNLPHPVLEDYGKRTVKRSRATKLV